MSSGDLVEITFWVPVADDVAPRTSVEVLLIPESGTPVPANFKTPATYGEDKSITLRSGHRCGRRDPSAHSQGAPSA